MIRIGTRKSELALAQTDIVNNLLKKLNYETSVFEIQTIGDKILDVPLSSIGEKSLFTKELETALLENTVDIVVHSLKDVATDMPNGLILGSILEREIPHDVLVLPLGKSGSISSLPDNSVVGTGSVRRIGQLKRLFPNLIFKDCRGNLNTRLKKLDANDNYDALILAYAGLHRLNLGHRVSQVLDFIYHAVGQAAIAIQCRSNDEAVLKMLNTLSHRDTLIKCTAERAFMVLFK